MRRQHFGRRGKPRLGLIKVALVDFITIKTNAVGVFEIEAFADRYRPGTQPVTPIEQETVGRDLEILRCDSQLLQLSGP